MCIIQGLHRGLQQKSDAIAIRFACNERRNREFAEREAHLTVPLRSLERIARTLRAN